MVVAFGVNQKCMYDFLYN